MKCLLCSKDTLQELVEGVELDLCVNCGGIWLDGGELEDLTGHTLRTTASLVVLLAMKR